MLRAEVEHLLCLANPTDQRARDTAALEDEPEYVWRRMRFGRCADQRHRAIALQQLEVGIQLMRGGDRVQDEVELAGMAGQLRGVCGNAHLVRPEAQAVGDLGGRGGEQHDVCAHRVSQFDAHVAEAAEADDTNLLAGSGTPVTQRGIGGDAGTEQGRHTGEILLGMVNAQDERPLDDKGLRVAAVGVLAPVKRPVVGAGKAIVAILLLALVARRAMAAAIDHAADPDEIAQLEFRYLRADGHNATDDLVARNRWVERVLPFVARGVQVGMAHAAVGDVDLHVIHAQRTPGDFHRFEQLVARAGTIGFDDHRMTPCVGCLLKNAVSLSHGITIAPYADWVLISDLNSTTAPFTLITVTT